MVQVSERLSVETSQVFIKCNRESSRCSDELDRDLLHQLRQHDDDALVHLVRRHGPALARVAYLQLGDLHAAEDVVQETLLAAWSCARRTRPATRLQPWLFGVLFNQCRKYRRSLWRRLVRERAAVERKHVFNSEQTWPLERIELLRKAMSQLDESLRAVVILRYERSFSVLQTAEALGLPEGTVKSRTHAARRKLKEYMEQLT